MSPLRGRAHALFIEIDPVTLELLPFKSPVQRGYQFMEFTCYLFASGSMSNSEVSITTPPAKSGLFTHVGNIPSGVKTDKENSPQNFTR